MEKDQDLTQLIDEIYDAALDSSRWQNVLAKVADYVGGQAAGLLWKDSVSKSANIYCQVGIDPYFVRAYSETYWKFDPVIDLPNCEIEQIVSIADLVPHDEFLASRFYREWVQPQGWVDAVNAVLEQSASSCAYLSIVRSKFKGMVDDEMRRRMTLIVPHVRRAVRTGKVIDIRQAEVATFANILDGLSPAIFLIDAEGQIVHGNAATRSLIENGNVMRIIHGRLTVSDPQVDQTLHRAITATIVDEEIGTKGSAMPLRSQSGERYVAHILPLMERNRGISGSKAVVALFVRKAELEVELPSEVIGRTYKLTPTELRVLLAIVEGGGVRQVAGNLGVADTTVKTHLGRLFEKTGVSRQADLVKLVAGYYSILVD